MTTIDNADWLKSDKKKYFYGIIESHMLLVENYNDQDYSIVRLFENAKSANEYRKMLIEREELPPSKLSVGTISLDELFEVIPELSSIAEDFFETPLKIVVANLKEDVIINEEELYDSNAFEYLN